MSRVPVSWAEITNRLGRPPRICLITPYPPEERGLAEYSSCLVEFLIEHQPIHVYVVAPGKERIFRNCYEDKRDLVTVHRIWNSRSVLNPLLLFKWMALVRPDVVHIEFGPYRPYGGLMGEPFLVLFFLVARILRIPIVVTLQNMLLPEDYAVMAKEVTGRVAVAWVARLYYFLVMKLLFTIVSKILLLVLHPGSLMTEKVRTTFDIESEKIGETMNGVILHRSTTVVPDATKEQIKASLGLQNKRILLFFGFLRRQKGIDYAIRAIKLLEGRNDTILLVAGKPDSPEDVSYLHYLKELARSIGVEKRIVFETRYLNERNLIAYVRASDVFLMPYVSRAGPRGSMPIALSFDLPVVATYDPDYLGGLTEAIKLVPPACEEAIARAVSELLDSQESSRDLLNKAKEIADLHKFEEIAKEHVALYADLISSRMVYIERKRAG